MANDTCTRPSAAPLKTAAAKYLDFRLNQESYGIAVLKIREIIRLQAITPVPPMPSYIKKIKGSVKTLLDIDRVVTEETLQTLLPPVAAP